MRRLPVTRFVFIAALSTAAIAHAELGGSPNPVADDQTRARTQLRAQTPAGDVAADAASASYRVQEQTTEIGTVIREYADNADTVFAVTWEGPSKPDLQALLGRYFQTFVSAPRQPGTGPVRIDSPELVVFSGGHPRAFFGRAYVPALIPAGVNLDVLP